MTRKTEPESARDMWWAQQQIAGNVKVVFEDAGNTPEEGALRSTEVSVRPYHDRDLIEVRKELWFYGLRDEGSWGWPIRRVVEWSRDMTFEKFRASEWWEPYLEKTKNFDFDSSWMDSFRVDYTEGDKCVDVSMRLPVEKRVWWSSSEVPTGSTVEYYVYVCDDGTVGIARGEEKTVERTLDEILGAVRFAERAHELGVSISEDGTITIGGGRDGQEG